MQGKVEKKKKKSRKKRERKWKRITKRKCLEYERNVRNVSAGNDCLRGDWNSRKEEGMPCRKKRPGGTKQEGRKEGRSEEMRKQTRTVKGRARKKGRNKGRKIIKEGEREEKVMS